MLSKFVLYDLRVNFNLGFNVDQRPDVATEFLVMALALGVESVGDVVAMVVMARQGVPWVSLVSGERSRETMLFLAAVMLAMAAGVLYTFAVRNVGWVCEGGGGGGGFCECAFVGCVGGEHSVLSAFCCVECGGG